MDCTNARLLAKLRGNRDSELPGEDSADLDRHLQSCPNCLRFVDTERKFDAPIARAMQTVLVPGGLKFKILDRLATQRGALHRRRVFAVVAAAAVVVIAVGLFTWKPSTRAPFDLNGLVLWVNPYSEGHQEKLDQWLAAQNFQPLANFDPHLLAFYGMAPLQGKQVPMLHYRNAEKNVVAQVFIVREPDFDLRALPESYGGGSLGFGQQIEIFHDKPNKLAYVVLFTGDSLEPFLRRTQST